MSALYDMTIYLSVTAAAILVIKTVFKKKMSARAHLLIWLLLLIRLFSPILPESNISVYKAIEPTYERAVTVTAPEIDAPENGAGIAAPSPSAKKASVLPAIYLFGATALFSCFVLTYLVYKKRTSENEPVTDSEALRIFEECRSLLGIRRSVALCYGEESMLSGVISPRITVRRSLSKEDLKSTLIHELCHLKHNDILLIHLASLLLCLNWFNPVMWLSFFTFKNDIELYCDSRTLRYTENKKAYAELLVRSAVSKNRLIFGTTALGNGKKTIAERIRRIASYKKPAAIWIVIIAFILVAVSAVCLTNSGTDYAFSKEKYLKYTSAPIGAIMAEPDFCDGERAVFHYLDGFFVYDMASGSVTEAIDLSLLNIAPHQQGSNGLWVRVTKDGKTAYLSSYGPKEEIHGFSDYVIDLDTGKVKEGKEPANADIFGQKAETYDVLPSVVPGWASDMCTYSDDAYYYLVSQGQISDMELIEYRGGEITRYPVFGGDAVSSSSKKAAAEFYLNDEFRCVYSPYYDITGLTISDWSEDEAEATFLYTMTYLYYNRDPDEADYIKEAKASGDEKMYQTLYDDYLAPKTSNYEFKIEFDSNDNVEALYYNASAIGTEWQKCSVSDFISN